MINYKKDMVNDVRTNMRGGKGNVTLTHIFQDSDMLSKTRVCAVITLEKGCSIGLHDHTGEEEVYYILSGKGKVTDDVAVAEVEAGDAVLTGNGKSHSIENIGEETLKLVAVVIKY